MRAVIKPWFIVVEEGDLDSATSIPPGPMDAFAKPVWMAWARARLDLFTSQRPLSHGQAEGFTAAEIEIHQARSLLTEKIVFS